MLFRLLAINLFYPKTDKKSNKKIAEKKLRQNFIFTCLFNQNLKKHADYFFASGFTTSFFFKSK